MSLIGSEVLAQADALAEQFRTAKPFRHVAIPDFFRREVSERLLADFPRFEERHALNEMGQVGGKAVRMDVRNLSDGYGALDRYIQGEEFLDFVSRVTGIADLLYDPDYVGGGTHENREGQELDAHVDFNYHPRTHWHRRLNLIVYLNPQWDPSWGGALELHADPWNERKDQVAAIPPLFNCCAIFETTETSWHGFSQIRLPDGGNGLSRKSFAIYLYTRERPPEETASPHATIYVPEAMPSGWTAGRTLDDADMRDLTQRFSRLRSQLRYLYDREKRFGAEIASLKRALDDARAAQRLALQGYATQPTGVSGVWPDGWASGEMSATFAPTRVTKGLALSVWCPPQIDADQELRIQLGTLSRVEHIRSGASATVRIALRAGIGEPVPLRISATRSWVPAKSGESADERPLAYKIVAAVLEH